MIKLLRTHSKPGIPRPNSTFLVIKWPNAISRLLKDQDFQYKETKWHITFSSWMCYKKVLHCIIKEGQGSNILLVAIVFFLKETGDADGSAFCSWSWSEQGSSSPNSVSSLNTLGGYEASSGSSIEYFCDPVKTDSCLGIVSLPL